MGTSRDVRDIMELGQAPAAPSPLALQPPRRSGPPNPREKRPDGITRELYALIGGNAPSLTLAHVVKPKFKERVKRTGPSVKWQWSPFTNPARGDQMPGDEGDKERDARKKLRLRHWVRDLPADHVEGAPDYKFHKFNTSSMPYSYTTEEYNHFLREDDWPREETDHLFALAQKYDVRFVVMADRWEYASERSVDDLKQRYYSVCRKLVRNRPAADEALRQATIGSLSFDKNREIDRKTYLLSLLSRTPAQIAEEDFLYVESRRLEQNYTKITHERAELLKILGGREGIGAQGGMNVGVGGGAKGVNVKNDNNLSGSQKRKGGPGWELEGLNGGGLPDGWAGEGSKRKATITQDISNCIERHPAPSVSATKATLYPSVSLRSSRVTQPKPTNLPKVQAALIELGISTHLVMPTKGNVEKLDGLQEALSKLVELKKANDRIESEMRMVRKRKEAILDPSADVEMESTQSRTCWGNVYCLTPDSQTASGTCGGIGSWCMDSCSEGNFLCASGSCLGQTGQCVAAAATPTGSMRARTRRTTELVSRGSQCPLSHTTCALAGSVLGFECIDTQSNLEQCGGCAAAGGSDCTALPGVDAVGCVAGLCEIWACAEGFSWSASSAACEATLA
ncbi:DNA methyltransferase 1-associated protein 1, partial [Phenoliferia sp. Uapishka_3]